MIKKSLLFMSLLALAGCANHQLSVYKDQQPEVDIQAYFTGPIKAWGVVQDRQGQVVRRFDVDMVGSWEGHQGKLEEQFVYYDGETQQRIWYIEKLAENSYQGRASDIVGVATGEQQGNAINWHYAMDVPVGDTVYRLQLDDWMWHMNDGVLINRSYFKKFGFTVAELTLVMKKMDN